MRKRAYIVFQVDGKDVRHVWVRSGKLEGHERKNEPYYLGALMRSRVPPACDNLWLSGSVLEASLPALPKVLTQYGLLSVEEAKQVVLSAYLDGGVSVDAPPRMRSWMPRPPAAALR